VTVPAYGWLRMARNCSGRGAKNWLDVFHLVSSFVSLEAPVCAFCLRSRERIWFYIALRPSAHLRAILITCHLESRR
jgi:hypothetical protein